MTHRDGPQGRTHEHSEVIRGTLRHFSCLDPDDAEGERRVLAEVAAARAQEAAWEQNARFFEADSPSDTV